MLFFKYSISFLLGLHMWDFLTPSDAWATLWETCMIPLHQQHSLENHKVLWIESKFSVTRYVLSLLSYFSGSSFKYFAFKYWHYNILDTALYIFGMAYLLYWCLINYLKVWSLRQRLYIFSIYTPEVYRLYAWAIMWRWLH